MPRFNRNRIAPAQIFKKRIVTFATNVNNATPKFVAEIELDETATVYAVKLSLFAYNAPGSAGDIQEIPWGIYCFSKGATTVPSIGTPETVDTANGFFVGSTWSAGYSGAFAGDLSMPVANLIREKFRFRRKCDRNTRIILTALGSTVRNGSAQSITCFGVLEVILRVR